MWDLRIKTKLLQLHQLQRNDNLDQQSLHERQHELENNLSDLENLNSQSFLKKRKDMMASKKEEDMMASLLKFRRTKEELT